MKAKNDITHDYLIKNFHYDIETGAFKRIIKSKNGEKITTKDAGRIAPNGYIIISINKRSYLAHRLAWLYVTGSWPACVIDHINREKADNRFKNLRDTTQRENSSNTKRNKRDMIGIGRSGCKWRAYIGVKGKLHHLGSYDTCDGASYAYNLAKYQVEKYGYLRDAPTECRNLNFGNKGNPNGNPKSNRRTNPSVNENKYLDAILKSKKKERMV